MDNSPRLPIASIVFGLAFVGLGFVSYANRNTEGLFRLNEIEIMFAIAAFSLVVFGAQGLISVLLEGRRLHPGIVRPRLTDPLSLAIVVFSLLLLALSVALGYGLVQDWEPEVIGIFAGAGCIVLAALLIFYKEAFIGDEACFDEREDGVPW